MLKIYEVIGYLNLSKELKIEDEFTTVNFIGGTRYPQRSGRYATEDKKIQKALESSPLFKNEYRLVQVGDKVLTEEEQVKPVDERVVELEKQNEELQKRVSELNAELKALKESGEKQDEYKEIPDITNGQQAKDYIVKTYNHDADKLKNKMLILQAAKKYKLIFPDWK